MDSASECASREPCAHDVDAMGPAENLPLNFQSQVCGSRHYYYSLGDSFYILAEQPKNYDGANRKWCIGRKNYPLSARLVVTFLNGSLAASGNCLIYQFVQEAIVTGMGL